MKRRHSMPFGAELREDGTTRFRIWAPGAKRVDVELGTDAGRNGASAAPLRVDLRAAVARERHRDKGER